MVYGAWYMVHGAWYMVTRRTCTSLHVLPAPPSRPSTVADLADVASIESADCTAALEQSDTCELTMAGTFEGGEVMCETTHLTDNDCRCLSEWEWDGVQYEGCAETPDIADKWCFVSSDSCGT